MRASNALLCGGAALALGACSLAPEYQPPALSVPAAYKETGPWQPAAATPAPAGRWWEAFGDTVLNDLEGRIEANNPDLAAAVARYDQAAGLLRQSQAQLLPQVSVGSDVTRARVSADRPLGSSAAKYTDLNLGASLAWEIDLFGRVRNTIRANAAGAQASASDVAGIRLGLQAALATAYFRMRGLDARIGLLKETVAAFQRAFDLTDARHEGGISSGLDVNRAKSQLASARAELSSVVAERATYEHAIAAYVGESPAGFAIAESDGRIPPPAVVSVGLPSTLLERRPDIAAAERRVAAANSRIGVARAAMFPSISLGGTAGFESGGHGVLDAANSFWALGPLSAALTIFDGGARRAGVRISKAEYEEAAATYRGTVLTAFREVEDDLALGRQLVAQERDQSEAAAAAGRTRDLALIRYREGASDYLEVVTAQNAALDAERALLEVRTRQLEIATDTFRAVGGSY